MSGVVVTSVILASREPSTGALETVTLQFAVVDFALRPTWVGAGVGTHPETHFKLEIGTGKETSR
jgi:hypothetical protein